MRLDLRLRVEVLIKLARIAGVRRFHLCRNFNFQQKTITNRKNEAKNQLAEQMKAITHELSESRCAS